MFLLAPFSWLYAAAMDVRNWMFNYGCLRQQRFSLPTICIGNLAVGGTGKTPHTEWLVKHLLEDGKRVATLSRGYGRKTRGFVEATSASTASEIGDEPLQMFLNFDETVVVAVCEDRCRGIHRLMERHPDIDVIVLDDAYQHRYVHPAVNVLLTDFSCPYYTDHVLPWGRLRERKKGASRADAIIVSKCPDNLTVDQQNAIYQRLKTEKYQRVFFTSLSYTPLEPSNSEAKIALLAGIARPQPLLEHLHAQGYTIQEQLIYKDHHNFTSSDIEKIEQTASRVDFIVTTAKDYARLRSLQLCDATRAKLIVQKINIRVLNDEDQQLYEYIKHAYADHY